MLFTGMYKLSDGQAIWAGVRVGTTWAGQLPPPPALRPTRLLLLHLPLPLLLLRLLLLRPAAQEQDCRLLLCCK